MRLRAHGAVLACAAGAPLLAEPPAAPSVLEGVAPALEAAWEELRGTGDFERAEQAVLGQLDLVLAAASPEQLDRLRAPALALRLVRQLKSLEGGPAHEVLDWLLEHEALAATLAFLVHPREDPARIYALLDRLRRERGEIAPRYPALTAAVCVVHDRALVRRVNENEARSPDPVEVFDYYVAHENQMLFGIRPVPAELLVYVVDTTASIPEMAWALQQHRGDAVVGARFFDVEYDFDHYLRGAPKKVTEAGWNLPNIRRYGGVCVDQAYYAVTVGKAIGVPTALTTGRSSEVGHAWVGFLQARNRRAWWNFDIGRYEAYQGVRGTVYDPQIRTRVPDSYVSLLAEMIGTSERQRHAAVACTDGARRLVYLARAGGLQAVPADGADETVRVADVPAALELVEHGLRANPGYAQGWELVRDLAGDGALTLAQKKRWAEVLHRLCGQRYPDFYLSILEPMIASIEDVEEQNRLWNQAFKLFGGRADLAASVRMSQGRLWERAGDVTRAGRCYEDVIGRFANDGHFVLEALRAAERLLVEAGQGRRVLALYERAFRAIRPPQDVAGPFYRQSNFYRVGVLYANWLERAGRHRQAAALRARIDR